MFAYMAMYQIPQFLDSGDKVFFAFNFIQLIFFVTGFMLSMGIFYLISGLFPAVGIYAVIPTVPIFFSFLYVAAGKFNGRDTYLYAVKFLQTLVTNPKKTYKHVADLSDLQSKFGSLDLTTKLKEFEENYQKKLILSSKGYLDNDVNNKAKFIKQLGNNLDANYINTSAYIAEKDAVLKKRQALLENLKKQNKKPFFK